MPSTYSQNLRIELIASGEQGNTWGNTTNNNLGTLIEQAISGYRSLDTGWVGNSITLTALNGANDQARNMYLEVPSGVSLSGEGEIIAPTVPKMYVIKNSASQAVRIKTGTSVATCLIPSGQTKVVVCDGSEFYEAVTAADYMHLANAPVDGTDATNRTYVDAGDAARLKIDGTQNMTGELILSSGGTPSNSLAAVSKQYVTSTYLPLTGGTMTGALTLASATPTGYQAVSRTYLDTRLPGIATSSALGLVKGGGNVSIDVDGTMTVSGVGTGTVTNVTGTAPISVVNGTSAPVISIPLATSSASGYLSSTDWGTFNGKMANSSAAVVSALGYTPYNSASIGSASVNYANSSGSCSGNAATATSATTAKYLNGSYAYSVTDPTYYSASTTYALVFGGYIKALTVGNTSGVAGYGAAMIVARTNTSNSAGSDGPAIIFAHGPSGTPGSITITSSSTAYNTSSDYRLKENQVPITNALDRVAQLKPYRFNFKVTPDKTVDGFFAHEVSSVVPEAIHGTKDEVDDEGNPVYQGIDQAKLVPLLVAAIQELKAEIDALKGA